ncbi:MAG TPA: DMT family protein [Tepidisphaeraceae bacterium]
MRTIILLVISNTFMTTAWYWHLKYKEEAIWKVVLISWLIALVEYCFAVPANRIGSQHGISGYQLKIIQEAITMIVFVAFATLYLNERLHWNYLFGFALVLLGVFVVFHKWGAA